MSKHSGSAKCTPRYKMQQESARLSLNYTHEQTVDQGKEDLISQVGSHLHPQSPGRTRPFTGMCAPCIIYLPLQGRPLFPRGEASGGRWPPRRPPLHPPPLPGRKMAFDGDRRHHRAAIALLGAGGGGSMLLSNLSSLGNEVGVATPLAPLQPNTAIIRMLGPVARGPE